FRIEHAQGAGGDAAPRFAKAGIIASVQPWLFYRGNGGASEYAKMMDSGVELALGSDAPITDFNPLFAIYAAVNGSDNGKRQALTVEQAVKAYTAGSAFAEFQENVKGTLEPGKFADIVILSADIF
ncbi:MAG TPA: amidohydrolase, partial [Blastocatellia bacterium]|nr:amidohydrolase [Blastocatellia bacterium]